MKKKMPSPQWRESISTWLETLIAANQSPETIRTRRHQMTTLSNELNGSPLDVDGETLLHWFAVHEWKPETRKGYRNAAVSYFGWMQASARRQDNPADALPSVRRPSPHPRPCPDRVILSALGRANEAETLMIRLGAECGLRRAEIAQVNSRDVMDDLLGRSLIVYGKGDKQRIVPLPDDLADSIETCHGWLFPGRWSGHVEASYIGKHVARLLGDGWTAHSLRHRYATTTYAATHDLYMVSKLLGHESMETTQRYVAMPDSRLRSALSAVSLVS
ncbi:tyrosine-type recombinase/integrase [Bifidobacterium crudilactis]|jgi:integrase|uniref:tyrosine-type recombinase/integrase n=1 Tax=Bifidobacterium crudilactis TaxID=327277 RepID=UPI0023574AEE|nr:site-specific integrase [Bifidobacterium crudilactis]MCI1868623.1 site-specific integrase [Bifidobacterium crudilactis]MDN5972679.1 site-specific integrase [Bifidobacterium crudilactis]MDN6000603.1 site-specific integrase [Bifidobacterium crudilactis]MDN6459461.1 site-specific integrase [Bifidobacterium crudilactis]MDN6467474.1 site-specific integrase [Bifidobacterium crudilactis]